MEIPRGRWDRRRGELWGRSVSYVSQTWYLVRVAHSAGIAGASSSVLRMMSCPFMLVTRLRTCCVLLVSDSEHSDPDDSGHSSFCSCRYSCIVISQCCAVSRILFRLSFVDS